MIRLFLFGLAGWAVVAVYAYAANTVAAVPLAFLAFAAAVVLTVTEERR